MVVVAAVELETAVGGRRLEAISRRSRALVGPVSSTIELKMLLGSASSFAGASNSATLCTCDTPHDELNSMSKRNLK